MPAPAIFATSREITMNKPEIIAQLPLRFTSQPAFFTNGSAGAMWEVICDNIKADRFTIGDCIALFPYYTYRTTSMYIQAIFAYVRTESGDDVLRRPTRNVWEWA